MTSLEQLIAALAPTAGVYVGGRWHDGDLGTYVVADPADKSVIAVVDRSDPDERTGG